MRPFPLLLFPFLLAAATAAEPLPLSTSYWRDPAFLRSFNASYRIEARIEPTVSAEERALLVGIQDLMAEGRREAAIARLQASPLAAESAALRFNLGNLRFEEGLLDEAVADYRAAIAAYPSFRRAHRNLAAALVRQEELEQALEHLVEAVRLGDSDGSTYGLLGYCRLQRGEWASALQAYRLAQLTEPETAEWKAGMAQCLQQLDAREEAAALLDEVIRQRPEEASYAVLQAGIWLDLGRPDRAAAALELPRRLERLDPDGLLLLADLHLRGDRPTLAREVAEEAFALEPGPSEDRVVALVAAAMASTRWELAGEWIERALPTEGPAPRTLRLAAARLNIESGNAPDEGAAELETLLGEDPADGRTLLALGLHRLSESQTEDAEILFERATADPATAADSWTELVRLHVAARRYESALSALDQALAIRPSDELTRYRESLAALAEATR